MDCDTLFPDVDAAEVDLGAGRRGYAAHPRTTAPVPGVVVHQDAFGLTPYLRSEVRRLAAAGFSAVAPDLFGGRTLGYDDKSEEAEALKTRPDDDVLAEIVAALAYLDGRAGVAPGPRGSVGFCMGGRLSFLTAARCGARIGAAVAFYGGGIAPDVVKRRPSLVHLVPDLVAPLLLLYGAKDASIPPAEHGRLATALSAANKTYALQVYADAEHGFATRPRSSYRAEIAEQAWVAALAFLRR